jgi:hypothetical protein
MGEPAVTAWPWHTNRRSCPVSDWRFLERCSGDCGEEDRLGKDWIRRSSRGGSCSTDNRHGHASGRGVTIDRGVLPSSSPRRPHTWVVRPCKVGPSRRCRSRQGCPSEFTTEGLEESQGGVLRGAEQVASGLGWTTGSQGMGCGVVAEPVAHAACAGWGEGLWGNLAVRPGAVIARAPAVAWRPGGSGELATGLLRGVALAMTPSL